MQDPQPLGLLNVRLSGVLGQELPSPSQFLRDLGIVLVRGDLNDFSPLKLGPDHEGVHRPLDVVGGVLLRLKRKSKNKYDLKN